MNPIAEPVGGVELCTNAGPWLPPGAEVRKPIERAQVCQETQTLIIESVLLGNGA
jgi:hypothetical protein